MTGHSGGLKFFILVLKAQDLTIHPFFRIEKEQPFQMKKNFFSTHSFFLSHFIVSTQFEISLEHHVPENHNAYIFNVFTPLTSFLPH